MYLITIVLLLRYFIGLLLSFFLRSLKGLTGIANPKVEVPALLIMGGKDYVLKLPGFEDYIRSGMVKHFVPNLDINFIEEGNHFVHEQLPDEVNELILKFIKT